MNTQDIPQWDKEELDRRLKAIKMALNNLMIMMKPLNDIIKELEN